MNNAPEVEGQSAPRFNPNDAGRDDATTHATLKASSDATDAPLTTLWLPVGRAAELEGVSVRAVQRRCASGKYRSRRAQVPQGERLEVDAATLTTQRRDGRDDEPEQRRDARDAKPSDEGAAVPDRRADEEAARLRAEVERERQERQQDREEIRFLRGLIEQHQRSEAELRAALRKALEIAPRQLNEGVGVLLTKSPLNGIEETTIATNNTSPENTNQQTQKSTSQQKEPRPLWKVILGMR